MARADTERAAMGQTVCMESKAGGIAKKAPVLVSELGQWAVKELALPELRENNEAAPQERLPTQAVAEEKAYEANVALCAKLEAEIEKKNVARTASAAAVESAEKDLAEALQQEAEEARLDALLDEVTSQLAGGGGCLSRAARANFR